VEFLIIIKPVSHYALEIEIRKLEIGVQPIRTKRIKPNVIW